ncbi:ice-binding family protein [Paenibacillus monticola]|uniref:DUF3494 domain-containing protein n=1 Tax=Paenibacillus monticola TaxID=2666075 RepID=A0A7X2H3J5_9BACL|nr:ice-binding family protein [Paenibacillus monticola]MRN52921.1 DUF3494 domain-containing protein [Paenibacillus monticola]
MKNQSFRRLLSSFLIVSMVLLSLSSAFAATAPSKADIKGHWAESQISKWIDKGFIKGYEDGSFKPNNTITRAEFMALVNRSFGFSAEAAISFSDVAPGNWAYVEVAKAVKAGYITGYENGTIGVSKPISRQEVAVIIARLLGLPTTAGSEASFQDSGLIATWAKGAVDAAATSNILNGYAADHSFKPTNSITRAEAVVVLDRGMAFLAGSGSPTGTAPAGTLAPTATAAPTVTVAPTVAPTATPSPTATTGNGTGIFYPTPTPITTLAAPINVVATAGDKHINLGWDSVTAATYYNVYQSSDAITYQLISTPGVVTTAAYDVTGLTNGTLYYFKVTAANTELVSIYSNIVSATPSLMPDAVELGLAGNFAILSEAGISTIPGSVITGDIGVSPIDATAITGFSMTLDGSNNFAKSVQVIGNIYAASYAAPTPNYLTTAINDLKTAYTDAAGRAINYSELYSGDLSGKTLTAGVYKWGTNVMINTDVTLHGDANSVFVFQVAGGISQASGTKVILTGGVLAKNIFWQSASTVALGTNAHFEGNVISMTNISLATGASINGRLLARTAVTLDQSTVTKPN